jgi:hypothetical protein
LSTSPLDQGAGGDGPSGALVEVAFAKDRIEGEMIYGLLENAGIPSLRQQVGLNVDGPQLGFGLASNGFGGGPQRVMVHANRAEQARTLLAETLVEDEYEDEDEAWRDTANAKFLENADGGRAGGRFRDYGVVGAYARAMFWSFGTMAVAFGVFLLLRVF